MAVLTAEKPTAERRQRGGGRGGQAAGKRQGAAGARAQRPGAPGPAARRRPSAGCRRPRQMPGSGIKHMIAVASGKGGVGKSTTAVNLALGLQAIGLKAGILDADIYGPSQPRLLGPQRPAAGRWRQQAAAHGGLRPQGHVDGLPGRRGHAHHLARADGGLGADPDAARRGPGASSTSLVIDMPPGTGDVQLTMAQQVPLSGAIIVSTPQDLALIDARKGLNMFRKVDVPVLGIVENMSFFLCPKCGERSDIFGHGGAKLEAEKLGIAFLGGVPLHMDIRVTSDEGRPIVATSPDSPHAQIYRDIASQGLGGAAAAARTRASSRRRSPSARTRASCMSAFAGDQAFTLSAEMLRVMSPSAEVQGHSPDQRVTVGRKTQRQDQGAAPRRQLRRAHRLRRRPRHGALRLVVSADARSGAREALGGIPLGVGGERLEPQLAAGADWRLASLHSCDNSFAVGAFSPGRRLRKY